MKQVLAMIACFFISHAVASTNLIRVQGTGSSFEEAKLSAFKTAVEFYSGSVIVSAVEVSANKIIQNEILNHSAGYINDYKVVSTDTITDKVVVVLDVWVSSSKISDKILGVTQPSAQVNGDQRHTQFQSLTDSLQQRDKIVEYVLKDFPKKAFTVSLVSHEFIVDNDRNLKLLVNMTFGWNYNYLVSFNEMLWLTTGNKNNGRTTRQNYITIMAKDPSAIFFGYTSQYQIQDNVTYTKIREHILFNRPLVQLKIMDANDKIIFSNCWESENLENNKKYYTNGENIVFFGNRKESMVLTVALTSSLQSAMKSFSKIGLSVVSETECKQ